MNIMSYFLYICDKVLLKNQNNMKKLQIILLGVLGFSLVSNLNHAQIITTVSGNGIGGFSGDGGQATAAEMTGAGGNVLFDHSGSFYFDDQSNSRIRKVNSSGVITTIAGNGQSGFSGDGGPATAAEFNQPTVITFDSSHNMYVVDYGNNRIRKINTSGTVSTFAGNGTASYSGDGGPAIAAELYGPCCVIADDTGNIYIADSWNNRIRKVNTSGIISLVAGTGIGSYSGDGGQAKFADLNKPFRIVFDVAWNMYIADSFNSRIRMINSSGIITTIAGNGIAGYSGDGGPASSAEINKAYGLSIDRAGNIYIGDTYNNRVREVNTSGTISLLAGNGFAGYSGDGGQATSAELKFDCGVSLDYNYNLYIVDYNNNRVRMFPVPHSTDGINELSNNNEIAVYPNPSNGVFTLKIENEKLKAENVKMQVYNIIGEQVQPQLSIINSDLSIDLSSQPNGIYIYRAFTQDGSLIGQGKLIIQK